MSSWASGKAEAVQSGSAGLRSGGVYENFRGNQLVPRVSRASYSIQSRQVAESCDPILS